MAPPYRLIKSIFYAYNLMDFHQITFTMTAWLYYLPALVIFTLNILACNSYSVNGLFYKMFLNCYKLLTGF